jgi:hypothetical protein
MRPGQGAGLKLRHRQHARVEDRIREAKAAGLRNLPSVIFSPADDHASGLGVFVADGVADAALAGVA